MTTMCRVASTATHAKSRMSRGWQQRASLADVEGLTGTPGNVGGMGDVSTFLDQMVSWAAHRDDVLAVGLAGSWARGTATRESDVDLILIVENVDELLNDDGWLPEFGEVAAASTEDWGLVQSRRIHYADGVEVEFGLTTTRWTAVPVDPGTSQVIADGFDILYDPDGLLQRCTTTVQRTMPS
jgi:uncharacterized protein